MEIILILNVSLKFRFVLLTFSNDSDAIPLIPRRPTLSYQ